MPLVPARASVVPEHHLTGRELLADAVTPWALKYPAVEVETTVMDGAAAWALVQASTGAALLVVGSRGHGGFDARTCVPPAGHPAAPAHRPEPRRR